MIKFFYGNEIDAINWKIKKFCFNNNLLSYRFNSLFTFDEIEKEIFQLKLFGDQKKIVYIIDFSKLENEQKINNFFKKLLISQKSIIFFCKNNNLNKDLINKYKIIVEKISSFSWHDKKEMIYFFLHQNKIKISEQNIEYMSLNLLANHHFIENEINKIALLEKTFSLDSLNIKQILFDSFNSNVFKIIDFWLQKKYRNLLKLLNEIAYNSSQMQWIIQVFITKLIQIKMFLLAMEGSVDKYMIVNNLGLSIFQQKIYKNLYFFPKNILDLINKILVKLSVIEIGIKMNEMSSFFSFVKILLDDRYDR